MGRRRGLAGFRKGEKWWEGRERGCGDAERASTAHAGVGQFAADVSGSDGAAIAVVGAVFGGLWD